ncbi:MAG: RDD family protein [bacterium]
MEVSQHHFAGLGLRIAALALDFIFLSLFFFPVTRLVKGTWLLSNSEHLWNYGWFVTDPLCLAFLAVIVLYFVVLEGLFGATLGKRVLGLRVVGEDGREPGLGPALVRNLLRAVDALPVFSILGMVLILTSPERTRLGDRIADTRVIKLCR